jgi:hypothetical protein
MATNFELAPPPKTVDGLLAVPIDIASIGASFVFDTATQTASADATISYEVGPTAGRPIFDLRQTPSAAWLDGAVFDVAKLAHHSFSADPQAKLRVIDAVQAAGSVHSLRVTYPLALPDAQLGGSYLPALDWLPGPRLRFVFGLSDLNRARYLEAWLPANLPFDQYSIQLTVQITGTAVVHSAISNAAITSLGTNHWQLDFPSRFSCLSPMLEVRAADWLESATTNTVLPVSGTAVAIECWMPAGSAVNLATQGSAIATLLAANETSVGPYLHGGRFVAFFNGSGGMEYEGGTTTSPSALAHEVFHSWFARGVKPSSQADGWWDEGFTRFHDDGADDSEPFDFGDPPILLCSRDPWQRHTAGNAYSGGSRFWRGMASLLGVGTFNSVMSQWYAQFKGHPASSAMIEEFLLARGGNAEVVDAFHRFVYGLDDSALADLWLRDDPGHSGSDFWGGTFWDSPDLWIRHNDDGGATHQQPEYGQDNWFHARVRNRSASATARHFAVSFHARGFAGTQFAWPADFLPAISAKVDFELAPGASRIVKARWPASRVPPAGTHTCLLAAVLARGDEPSAGQHVWERNNLAQKNLTVVDLVAGEFFILPVVVAHRLAGFRQRYELELWRREGSEALAVSLVHRSERFFNLAGDAKPHRFIPDVRDHRIDRPALECGGPLPGDDHHDRSGNAVIGSRHPELVARHFGPAFALPLPPTPKAALAVELPSGQQRVGLLVQVDPQAKSGQHHRMHLVQRQGEQIVGGVALAVRVLGPSERSG